MMFKQSRDSTGGAVMDCFLLLIQCQAKFPTCEISDLTPCAHAQSDILHIKYAEKTYN